MIVAIVASLSIIPAGQALEGMRNRDFFRKAELQLQTIISTAEILAINGPGNVRTIALDFSGGGSVRFERLLIGDTRGGANMTCVILTTTSGGALATVRRIIAKHGGEAWAEGIVGVGATFYFTIGQGRPTPDAPLQ